MKKTVPNIPDVLRGNAAFFWAFLLFLTAGAFLLGSMQTGDLVLFFSRHRTPGLDLFFYYANYLGDGLIFVPAFFFLLFVRFRFAATIPALGLSVSLLTQSAKAFFGHPRPFVYFREMNMLDQLVPVDGVAMHQGMNSFPSGHTMTAFSLFAFLALCLTRKSWTGLLLFILALLAGLSRIYLLQHFFKDVYMGAALGVLLAVFWYLAQYRLWPEPHFRMDGALQRFAKR